MNIFVTDISPQKSAEFLDNQRVVKMILESCQMLSTALFLNESWESYMTMPTHIKHPCTVWASEFSDNWLWLYEHANALDQERILRFGSKNIHKTLKVLNENKIYLKAKIIKSGFSKHVNCARNSTFGVDFTSVVDVFLAYRLYLFKRWELQKRNALCYIKQK